MNAHASEHEGRGLALLALVTGALGIAFAPILAKSAGDLGTTASAFWRTGLAVPMLLSFSVVMRFINHGRHKRRGTAPPERSKAGRRLLWLVVPGVLFAGDLASWHLALSFTTAAASTLLANLQAVIVGFIGWAILKEKLSPLFALGAGLALGGTVLLLLAPGVDLDSASNPMLGNMISIVTAIFYASYILSIKKARRTSTTVEIMIGASLTCTIVLYIIAVAAGEQIMPRSRDEWLCVFGLALIPHCLGQGMIAFALAKLPASFSSVTLLVQPVAAACWGWLFLKEPLTGQQIAAGLVVVVGIYLARRGSGIRRG